MRRKDGAALALLCLLAALAFLPAAVAGRTMFWGDLTYLQHPWRALPAQALQAGRLPLWNPYAYLGMPMAAQMQSAVWYPGTLPFHLFGFETALLLFTLAHYALAGCAAFLWLRRLRLGRAAAFGSASAFMLGGVMTASAPFLNHVSTLAFLPVLLLLAARPLPLALALALAFLSGYPQMLAGAALAAFLFETLRAGRPPWRTWALAAPLAAALSACLLGPALELLAHSRRAGGVPAAEMLTWSFSPRDLVQFLAPPLIPAADFSPSVLWWKTAYLGLGTLAAAALGLWRMGRAKTAFLLAYAGAVVLLVLGGTNPLSRAVWENAPLLGYIRYPGNAAYLILPAVMLAAARGLDRLRWAWAGAALIAAELLLYAAGAQPSAARPYFTDPGPLVRRLQAELGGRRYLLSPRALHGHRGGGADPDAAARDLKHRLYGVTNAPWRLAAAANFGEPLTLAGSYAFMDRLFSAPGAAAVAPWLAWADVGLLLTAEPVSARGLVPAGRALWHAYRTPPGGRAFFLEEAEAARLPEGLPAEPPPAPRRALAFARPREDLFVVRGDSPRPGWAFVSEPPYPGWRVQASTRRALGAFQLARVPAGAWTLSFRYDPLSWRLGLAATLASLLGVCAYLYNRLRPAAA